MNRLLLFITNHKVVCTFLAAMIAVAIIAVVVVKDLFRYNAYNMVNIVNYSDAQNNMTPLARERVRTAIYDILQRNVNGLSEDSKINVSIRQDTYNSLALSSEITSASFVVDIDEYKQTYEVGLSWYVSGNIDQMTIEAAVAKCVARHLMKYPEEECTSLYNTSSSVDLYLPFVGTINDSIEFQALYDYADGNEEHILIDFNNCNDDNLIKEAISLTKSWLNEQGLDAEKYVYDVPTKYENCILR